MCSFAGMWNWKPLHRKSLKKYAGSPMKRDITEYVATLIEALKLQADLIDKLFMELLEAKSTEEISGEIPFLIDMAAEFKKEFEDE